MEKLSFNLNDVLLTPFGGSISGMTDKTLGQLITTGVGVAITISGVAFMFLIIYGGFSIIKGSGKNDPQSYAKAKDYMTYAILGFIIIATAYLFIRVFELILGSNFITAPGL